MSVDAFAGLEPQSIVVIGLGRFGGSVARSLQRMGHEVLGIDRDADLVQDWACHLTHVAQADTTNVNALKQLGVGSMRTAVVGIGSDVEASVLTVLALEEAGVRDIWAKATSSQHARLLERTGAHHVVHPEADMGERVAHMVGGKMMDYIEFADAYAIAKTRAPRESWGKTLSVSALRSHHGVTVIGVKRQRADFAHATPDTLVEEGDLLIVSGPTAKVERFAALP